MKKLTGDEIHATVTVGFVVLCTILLFIFVTIRDEKAINHYQDVVISNDVYETNVYVDSVEEEEGCIIFEYENKFIYNYEDSIYEKCEDKEGEKVPCYLRVIQMGNGDIEYMIDDVRL